MPLKQTLQGPSLGSWSLTSIPGDSYHWGSLENTDVDTEGWWTLNFLWSGACEHMTSTLWETHTRVKLSHACTAITQMSHSSLMISCLFPHQGLCICCLPVWKLFLPTLQQAESYLSFATFSQKPSQLWPTISSDLLKPLCTLCLTS